MSAATVDFMKAKEQRTTERKGSVSTDKKSDMFEMKMGTKQGDPLFSFLFNTVLQMALNDDVERWQKTKGMGIRLRDQESECLTNLRYYLSGRVRNILGKNYVSATGNSKDQKIESEPPGHRSTDASKS